MFLRHVAEDFASLFPGAHSFQKFYRVLHAIIIVVVSALVGDKVHQVLSLRNVLQSRRVQVLHELRVNVQGFRQFLRGLVCLLL